MMIRDAHELLTQWGRWSLMGAGVPGCFAPGDELSAFISDEDALMVDSLVGRLSVGYVECANVIKEYYRHDLPFSAVARKVGFGEEKTRQLWKSGVAWIDGALDGRRKAA